MRQLLPRDSPLLQRFDKPVITAHRAAIAADYFEKDRLRVARRAGGGTERGGD